MKSFFLSLAVIFISLNININVYATETSSTLKTDHIKFYEFLEETYDFCTYDVFNKQTILAKEKFIKKEYSFSFKNKYQSDNLCKKASESDSVSSKNYKKYLRMGLIEKKSYKLYKKDFKYISSTTFCDSMSYLCNSFLSNDTSIKNNDYVLCLKKNGKIDNVRKPYCPKILTKQVFLSSNCKKNKTSNQYKCDDTDTISITSVDKYKNLSDFTLCVILLKNGEWIKELIHNKEYFDEKNKRNLKKEKCIHLTDINIDSSLGDSADRLKNSQKQKTLEKEILELSKIENNVEKKIVTLDRKSNIKLLKKDCKEMGFVEGSEGMASCVLKLTELDLITNNNSSSINELEQNLDNSSELKNKIKELEKIKKKIASQNIVSKSLKKKSINIGSTPKSCLGGNNRSFFDKLKCGNEGSILWHSRVSVGVANSFWDNLDISFLCKKWDEIIVDAEHQFQIDHVRDKVSATLSRRSKDPMHCRNPSYDAAVLTNKKLDEMTKQAEEANKQQKKQLEILNGEINQLEYKLNNMN